MIITKTHFGMSFFGGGTDFENFFAEHGGSALRFRMGRNEELWDG